MSKLPGYLIASSISFTVGLLVCTELLGRPPFWLMALEFAAALTALYVRDVIRKLRS